MKNLTIKLLITLMPVILGVSYAATSTKVFDIQVKHIEFLKIVGSATGSVGSGHKKIFSVASVRDSIRQTVGTLGLESTFSGDCDFGISSLNGFSLKYEKGNQRLTDYQLIYSSATTEYTITSDINFPLGCNTVATALDFQATGNFKKKAKAGLYSDTVTFTVTSP